MYDVLDQNPNLDVKDSYERNITITTQIFSCSTWVRHFWIGKPWCCELRWEKIREPVLQYLSLGVFM